MVEKILKNAMRRGNTIFGFRRSMKFLKMNRGKMVIIAENMPEDMRKDIEYLCKISKIKVKIFKGSSKDLGIICGKPYPITTVVIKG